jgi:integrase/recombinase XerD
MGSGSGLGMAGPLAAFAPGFGSELVARGYRPGSAASQLQLMADASGWLAAHGLEAGDLTEALVERLMAERRTSGRSRLLSSRALSPLVEYLRGLGVVRPAVAGVASTPSEELVGRYSAYLLERRGLAPSTVRNYVGVARVFLAWRERTVGGLELDRLDAAAVSEFVLAESRRSCVGSAKCMVRGCGYCCGSFTWRARSSTRSRTRSRLLRAGGWRDWSRRWTAGRFSGC